MIFSLCIYHLIFTKYIFTFSPANLVSLISSPPLVTIGGPKILKERHYAEVFMKQIENARIIVIVDLNMKTIVSLYRKFLHLLWHLFGIFVFLKCPDVLIRAQVLQTFAFDPSTYIFFHCDRSWTLSVIHLLSR